MERAMQVSTHHDHVSAEARRSGGSQPAEQYTPALDVVINYLRLACSWPVDRGWLASILGRYVLPFSFACSTIPQLVYCGLGEHSGSFEIFGLLADALGSTMCGLKIFCLQRHTGTILTARSLLDGFAPLEQEVKEEAAALNERSERSAVRLARRFVRTYSTLSVLGITAMAIAVIFDDPSLRWLPVKAPRVVMESRGLYAALASYTIVELYVFPIAIGIYDGLFLTLCLHIACKCEILSLMLRRAVRDLSPDSKDVDSATEESFRQLRQCVVYHHRIIELHHAVESIFSSLALFQIFYNVFGLGTPAFRMLDTSHAEAMRDVLFGMTYVLWTFIQLLSFCYFGDIVAKSSASLAKTCYESFHPTLLKQDSKLATIQQLLPLFAQRPLYLTAGRLFKLTLKLFEDVMKRSYSLYSTVLRMR
nr:odorant receptor [Odontothrips loti]